jgi:hypothetical protein
MSTTVAPSTPAGALGNPGSKRAQPAPISSALRGLAIVVAHAAVSLGIAFAAGATFVFNVLVWLLFTVLWLAVLVALAFSPRPSGARATGLAPA